MEEKKKQVDANSKTMLRPKEVSTVDSSHGHEDGALPVLPIKERENKSYGAPAPDTPSPVLLEEKAPRRNVEKATVRHTLVRMELTAVPVEDVENLLKFSIRRELFK